MQSPEVWKFALWTFCVYTDCASTSILLNTICQRLWVPYAGGHRVGLHISHQTPFFQKGGCKLEFAVLPVGIFTLLMYLWNFLAPIAAKR